MAPSSPDTTSTSPNSTCPSVPVPSFSTRITSPGATRYCLPPARMTAYIALPPKVPHPAHTNARSGTPTILCACCVSAAAISAPAGGPERTRFYRQTQQFYRVAAKSVKHLLGHGGTETRSQPRERDPADSYALWSPMPAAEHQSSAWIRSLLHLCLWFSVSL